MEDKTKLRREAESALSELASVGEAEKNGLDYLIRRGKGTIYVSCVATSAAIGPKAVTDAVSAMLVYPKAHVEPKFDDCAIWADTILMVAQAGTVGWDPFGLRAKRKARAIALKIAGKVWSSK